MASSTSPSVTHGASPRSAGQTRTPEKPNGKSSQVGRRSPAARRLATPTDLSPEQVDAIAKAVNPLVADSIALYVKTKNFHWHVTGSHFRDYHLLFDEHADQILGSIDLLAERLRRIGATTIRSVAHAGRLQTIADDDDEYVSPHDMIERLLADNRQMVEHQRQAIEICSDNDDEATSSTIQEIIDLTEKRVWFLHAITQGGEHVE